MSTDETLLDLIDRAAHATGTEYKLAKLLGIHQSQISMWKSGAKPCPPEDRARLAGVAGEDAAQELIRATIARHAGTKKGEQLYKLLGNTSRAIGGGLATVLLALASLTFWPTRSEASPALHDV